MEYNWATTWQNQQSDCEPSEDSDQPGHPPNLIRVFAVRMKKAGVFSYPLSVQRRLWSDCEDSDQTGRMPRLIWVFAGHTVTLLVLSWGGSVVDNLSNWCNSHSLKFSGAYPNVSKQLYCFCLWFTFYGYPDWYYGITGFRNFCMVLIYFLAQAFCTFLGEKKWFHSKMHASYVNHWKDTIITKSQFRIEPYFLRMVSILMVLWNGKEFPDCLLKCSLDHACNLLYDILTLPGILRYSAK